MGACELWGKPTGYVVEVTNSDKEATEMGNREGITWAMDGNVWTQMDDDDDEVGIERGGWNKE
jgi:hypothetical protein